MKIIFVLLCCFVNLFGSDYSIPDYIIPDEMSVINTFEDNGLMTIVDQYGNGADIYISTNNYFEWDFEVQKIDPVSKIILLDKGKFKIETYVFLQGPASTHNEFLKLLTNFLDKIGEKGIRNAQVCNDCFGSGPDGGEFDGSYGRSPDVHAIQVR